MDTQWPCVRHMAEQHVYVCVWMDQAGASFVSKTVGLFQTIVQNGQLPSTQYHGPSAVQPAACCLVMLSKRQLKGEKSPQQNFDSRRSCNRIGYVVLLAGIMYVSSLGFFSWRSIPYICVTVVIQKNPKEYKIRISCFSFRAIFFTSKSDL